VRGVTTANGRICYERRCIAGVGLDKVTWMKKANRNRERQWVNMYPWNTLSS